MASKTTASGRVAKAIMRSPSSKQKCILEFCKQKDDLVEATKEVIILDDDKGDGGKIDDKDNKVNDHLTVIYQRSTITSEIVCPICNKPLDHLTVEERMIHADECLSVVSTLTETIGYTSMKVKREMEIEQDEEGREKKKIKKVSTKTDTPARRPRPRPPIPDHKILQLGEDKVAVDAFCYDSDDSIHIYILTHFHSDHYGGLKKSWNNGSVIIATKITAKLAVHRFKLPAEMFLPLEYDQKVRIPNTAIDVTCIDGNHCPGSGIFILESAKTGERFLHCGDFRINRHMIERLLKWGKFDRIYLDTTYLDPQYSFPKQENVVGAACRVLCEKSQLKQSSQKRVIDFFCRTGGSPPPSEFLVVIGTYSIGKERLAIGIAEKLGTKIYCNKQKAETLKLLEWNDLERVLETNPNKAKDCQVHMISTRGMNKAYLAEYLGQYSREYKAVVGINATGWTFQYNEANTQLGSSSKGGFESPNEFLNRFVDPIQELQIYNTLKKQFQFRNKQEREKDFFLSKILRVPYSEHSSFRELFYFVNLLPSDQIIPTVNLNRNDENMRWINMFKGYKGDLDLNRL
ncbi:DEKNAAC102740 [Brettanomyces naardenensis]|uniref:DEKNAAC102740 n=1 Tax=Brettanomyces naardenensis TaxID=13370 RepID=A0A448YKB2_BRENA|nr:DEKNAAC102740 [Brettanomyces naardenensis]